MEEREEGEAAWKAWVVFKVTDGMVWAQTK